MRDTSAQKAETSVLTLDIGSSSIRANLYSEQGKQLTGVEAKVEYKVNLTPDGGVEIGPADILTAVAEAVDIALRNAGKQAGSIAGVGICSLVSNILGVDSEGKALTPIYTWADTRCAEQAA